MMEPPGWQLWAVMQSVTNLEKQIVPIIVMGIGFTQMEIVI